MGLADQGCQLLELPNELIQHIFSFLQPADLAKCALTSRALHTLSYEDCIWQPIVNDNLTLPIDNPAPLSNFRELYTSLQPYWYLVKQRIWFADSMPSGKLLMARYEPSDASIEAHQVTAIRGTDHIDFWEKNDDVIIHSFDPVVTLDQHQAVIKITAKRVLTDHHANGQTNAKTSQETSCYNREIVMRTFAESGLYASLSLCRALDPEAIGARTKVWPPLRFPADSRTRNESHDNYSSAGHRPTRLSNISEDAFRLRKWVQFTGRQPAANGTASPASVMRSSVGWTGFGFTRPAFLMETGTTAERGMRITVPEDIATYATLPRSCYTPTAEKPWQGIWCGDYSGHGCEFLLVTQPDVGDEQPLPAGMSWLRNWLRTGQRNSRDSGSRTPVSHTSAEEELPPETTHPDLAQVQHEQWLRIQNMGEVPDPSASADARFVDDLFIDHKDAPKGRLEAIKLTGDPNIPRGEYTFIAPDIGSGGFMRIADEAAFNGARIVRSAGHIAGRGFREDQYTPSQLIMISPTRLAQLWMGFGHISYYQRVDLDALGRTGIIDAT